MFIKVLKSATNTYHMQHPFSHDKLNKAKNRYANWQGKGVLVFTITAILSLGIAPCFFIATAYFKHKKIVKSRVDQIIEQKTTSIANRVNIIEPSQQSTSQIDLKSASNKETSFAALDEIINQLSSLFCLSFPISKGILVLSLENVHSMKKTEVIPISESIPNASALNTWMVKNSDALKKLVNCNTSVRHTLKFHLVIPSQGAGSSNCYMTRSTINSFELIGIDSSGKDGVRHVDLEQYLDAKHPSFKTELTGLTLEEIFKNGNINIDEAYVKTESDFFEDFRTFFGAFSEKNNTPIAQLREKINSDIKELPPLSDLPDSLQVVYDQLLTKNLDYKQLFNLTDPYSKKDVTKAAKKIALCLHPDKNLSHPSIATQLFVIMSQIRVVLEEEATA